MTQFFNVMSGITLVGNSGQFWQDNRCPEFNPAMCFSYFFRFLLDLDKHTLVPLAYEEGPIIDDF